MKNFLIIISIGFCVTVAAAPYDSATSGDDDSDFLPNPESKQRICIAEDKREGICVHEDTCTEAFNIEIHGIIDESELRIGTCPGDEWCCVHPNVSLFTKTPHTPTPPPQRGMRSERMRSAVSSN